MGVGRNFHRGGGGGEVPNKCPPLLRQKIPPCPVMKKGPPTRAPCLLQDNPQSATDLRRVDSFFVVTFF